ncbi:MAG: nucleotide exchange factor GrpE [Phycisphaerae bacterium]|nr:nucleotide exchange factor GrpE [Phycisphaerae bacterium]
MIKKNNAPDPADDQTPAPEASAAVPEEVAPDSHVQAELAELMDRLKRTTADYQNYQKRVAREVTDARRYAVAEFAKEILVVVDDLERAMQVKSDAPDAKAILDGVRITHEHLTSLLAKYGVTPIEAAGKPFDPQLHEAMMQQPSDDVPPMTVLTELSRGYRLHDRTLRPAKVIVSSGAAAGGK